MCTLRRRVYTEIPVQTISETETTQTTTVSREIEAAPEVTVLKRQQVVHLARVSYLSKP